MQTDPESQRQFKVSYLVDSLAVSPEEALPTVHDCLSKAHLAYNLVLSHSAYLDVLPYRASKGKAIRYMSAKWDIPLERIVTAGDSGNDRDMLAGRTAGVVVGNHTAELDSIRQSDQVYFAEGTYADGIIEGLQHYSVVPVHGE